MTVGGMQVQVRGWVAIALTAGSMLAAISLQFGLLAARIDSLEARLVESIEEDRITREQSMLFERRLAYCEGWIAAREGTE